MTPELKIIHGDCLTELQKMPSEIADVVCTSPPYNIGKKYSGYSDNLENEEYLRWLFDVGSEIKRIMKPQASFFLNVGSTNTQPHIAMDVCQTMRKLFILQNNIVWVKSITVNGVSSGHFKPINSKRFMNHNHESVFHFTKEGNVPLDRLAIGVPYTHKSNVTRWKGEQKDVRCDGNVWFIPYKTVQSKKEKFNHPAGYPVELVKRCIKLHGQPHPLVIDPFLGAGTTLVACRDLGVAGIGIELDESYCRISRQRLLTQEVNYAKAESLSGPIECSVDGESHEDFEGTCG